MIARDNVDGAIAEWNADPSARCLCDVRATIVYLLPLSKRDFEDGMARLEKRQSARAAYLAAAIEAARRPFAVLDGDMAFRANDTFEEAYGREPLDAFIVDTDEVLHQHIGDYFAFAGERGVMTSPMTAGPAFEIAPSRSFRTEKARDAFSRGKRADWRPSVRTEIAFVLAGTRQKVAGVMAECASYLSGCGLVTRLEHAIRVPELPDIPVWTPRAFLAEVRGDGTREAHHVK